MDVPSSPTFHHPPSVLDRVTFDALPEETRALVVRLFGRPHDEPELVPHELLRRVYRRAWAAALGHMGQVVHFPPKDALIGEHIAEVFYEWDERGRRA